MRIISGKYKGRRIVAPKNLPVRPTTDFAKEGLFNIIGNHFYFEELHVLDLFAGTGNITYEFASRGAKEVNAVDVNAKCMFFIKKTSTQLGLENLKIYRASAFTFIKRCKHQYDVIFADPPYDMKEIEKLPDVIFEKNLLKENGWLIIEHSGFVDLSGNARFKEKRSYGSVNFSIFT
ncbi:MAG: 16S rRNA (guanine(966)-N(2))-methyltransferase RsmD [Flavobacteriales bacterium]|nr:MAG: 16S rRNA (guanine(966)-N(2))-methyltransferase RsmD [Flavobacteriales bacterium]